MSADQNSIGFFVGAVLNFDTITWQTGSFYNTTTKSWTPPAGTCLLQLYCELNGVASGQVIYLYVYKNGGIVSQHHRTMQGVIGGLQLQFIDRCNGTDNYYLFLMPQSVGNANVNHAATVTRFSGTML